MNKDDLKEFEKQVRIGLRNKLDTDDFDHENMLAITYIDKSTQFKFEQVIYYLDAPTDESFDVVSIDGEKGRIMSRKSKIRHKGQIRHYTSIAGFVPEDEMTLIEHTSLPTLNIGDEVIIHDVPNHEQNTYPLGWTMPDTFIYQYDKPRRITDIMFNDKLNIPSYQIDNEYWFTPYHLEKL